MVTLGTIAPGSLRQEGQEFKVNLAVQRDTGGEEVKDLD